jgi:hypothetical protein
VEPDPHVSDPTSPDVTSGDPHPATSGEKKKKYLVPTRYYLSICDVFLRTPTVQVLTAWIRVLGRV